MEFKIQKTEFLKGLYPAQGIADRKATLPILANVLLRSDGKERVLVAATDLQVGVSAELACKVEKEGGITLGAKHLFDIVKALPGEDLVIRPPTTTGRRSKAAARNTAWSAWRT